MKTTVLLRSLPPFRRSAARRFRRWLPLAAGIGVLFGLVAPGRGQPECRSVLGASLKPLSRESPFSWAGEIVTIPAYLENRYANNSMLFGGLDFTSRSKTHQVYFEGGVKRSTVDASGHTDETTSVAGATGVAAGTELGAGAGTGTATGSGKGKPPTAGTAETAAGTGTASAAPEETSARTTTQTTYGWRELFYQYHAGPTRVRAGLSTTRLGDYFLVNERIFGVSLSERIGRMSVNAAVGTVGEYARMTEFCGTKRLTNLVDKEKYETVSEEFGDTNMAGVVVLWDLRPPAAASPQRGADEFALTDDLAPRPAKSASLLSRAGLVAYHELDRRTETNRTWVGGLAQADLPFGWTLKAQGLYQAGAEADALIYYGLAEKEFYWSNASNTTLHAGYFGKYDLRGPARFEASFSNLFQGEIMRMDAVDVPLLFTGVRHNFPGKRKLHLQLQGVRQLNGEKMKEIDLEAGIDLFKRLRVVAIGSYVYSRVTADRENLVAKMEVRFGF